MPKVINRGPTHRIEVDDLVLERDAEEGVELTQDQIDRIRQADPSAELEGAPAPKEDAPAAAAPRATSSTAGSVTVTATPPTEGKT